MIWTKYAVKVGFSTHRSAFFFDIRQYAFRKETLRWIKTATFSVLRSFERADFCHGKAKICRNTRLFQRFLTQMWRKDAFQNHIRFECINLRVTGAIRTMPESESFQRFSAFRDWKASAFLLPQLPKIILKSFAFGSKIFYREDFWLVKAQNVANPWRICEYFNEEKAEIIR